MTKLENGFTAITSAAAQTSKTYAEKSLVSRGRVLVAMSGGVDSSVAASLLVEQGYEVIGATMQVWDYSNCDITEGAGTCCSSLDVEEARSVADTLGIPFYVINCEGEFKQKVIDPFVQSYLRGQTPLPCVNCNTYLKFDYLIKKMEALGCDYLATGHYAKIEVINGDPQIVRSDDSWKDQTYFLFTLEPKILSRLIFPIGHLKKSEVREIAEKKGLAVAGKKDSTGICFVSSKGYGRFIEEYFGGQGRKKSALSEVSGNLIHYPTGKVLGQHPGIHHFTIGQSKGLGLDYHEKLFVIKIDVETKEVFLGEEQHLFKGEALVKEVNWLDPRWAQELSEDAIEVKVRYTARGSLGTLKREGDQIKVKFLEPQRAITPGQAAVFYRNQQLLGGGWIV